MLYYRIKSDCVIKDLGIITISFFANEFLKYCKSKTYIPRIDQMPLKILHLPVEDSCRIIGVDNEQTGETKEDISTAFQKSSNNVISSVGKSLSQLGVHIDLFWEISNNESTSMIIDQMAETNQYPLNEEFCDSNMDFNQKVSFMVDKLNGIQANGSPITVVDAYFFSPRQDADYCEMVAKILIKSQVLKMKVITNGQHYDSSVRKNIENKSGIEIQVLNSSMYHDRYWINESNHKGFQCGTSLNGIGKGRAYSINEIPSTDICQIEQKLSNESDLI